MSERLRRARPRPAGRRRPRRRRCTTRRSRSSTRATPASTTSRLVALIDDRIAFVPRYRQRVRRVPGRLANPVWVDDPDFDLAYHVRRSALPRPGTMDQLRELTARIMSRRLDRDRPLWEIYFVEGLEDGRVALLSKSHQILVDGISTVDLGQVLLDVDPRRRGSLGARRVAARHEPPRRRAWRSDAVAESGASPADRRSTPLRSNAALGRPRAARRRRATGRRGRRRAVQPPLAARVAVQHRARCPSSAGSCRAHRRSRTTARSGGSHGGTVNDVILATLSGAIRAWLMTRAESLSALRRLRRWCR